MAETHYCKSRWMQEHPWLDRLYVKLALQVKKEQKQKKLAIIEPKMKKKNKNKNQRKLGEPTPATCFGGCACRWIMRFKRNWTSTLGSTLAYEKQKQKEKPRGRTSEQPSTSVRPGCSLYVVGVLKLCFFRWAWLGGMVAGVQLGLLYTGALAEGCVLILHPKTQVSGIRAPRCLPAHHLSHPSQILQTSAKPSLRWVLGQALTHITAQVIAAC